MADTDAFIKGGGNPIILTLSEDDTPITNSPTEIVIEIGNALTITRTPTGNGVDWANGQVTIVPRDLTEDLSVLEDERLYDVRVKFSDAQNPDIVYGGNDGIGRISFLVSSAP